MAVQSDIDSVKLQLPDIATEFGYTDEIIGALLDSGSTQNQAILAGWNSVAAKSATFTDVSESGSSRNMSAINANARAQVTYWQTQVDRDNAAAGTTEKTRFASYTATRV